MKYNKFWVYKEGEAILKTGRQKIRCLGGSNISLEDAANEALKKIRMVEERIHGKKAVFDEYTVEIQEELIQEIDTKNIITRNYYGALILNSESMMIMDIDYAPKTFWELFGFSPRKTSKERIIAKLDKLLAGQYKDLAMRVYETPKGIRCIVNNREFKAASPETEKILKAFNNDWLYGILCRKQDCFRARLTAKPYRCKVHKLKSRFPRTSEADIEEYENWKKIYDEKSKNYSSCRFIKQINDENGQFKEIIKIHDRICGAFEKKHLA